MKDRRQWTRHRRRLSLRYGSADLSRAGFTGDISSGGLFIEGDGHWIGDPFIHIQLFVDKDHFKYLEGVVVHQKRVPPEMRRVIKGGFGVRFLMPVDIVRPVLPKGEQGANGSGAGEGDKVPEAILSIAYETLEDLRRAEELELRAGGLFVPTDIHLPVESTTSVAIHLPFASISLELPATVLRIMEAADGGPHGLGLGFGDKVLLRRLLGSFLTPAEPPAPVASPPAPETPAPPPEVRSPDVPSVPEFEVSYRTAEELRAAHERELKHGGLFVTTDSKLRRDARAAVTLHLPFAGIHVEDVETRVIHVSDGGENGVAGVGLAFVDAVAILTRLAPHLPASKPADPAGEMTKLDVVASPISLTVRRVVDRIVGPSAKHQAVLELDDIVVRADMVRVEQVLENLVDNAVRYSPAGGEIAVTAHAANGDVVIEIRDEGQGFEPAEVAGLFEPSLRPRRPARRDGGLGLGLFLAKEHVTLMGGRIWAESSGTGEGALFAFTLPRPQS